MQQSCDAADKHEDKLFVVVLDGCSRQLTSNININIAIIALYSKSL